ncbi:divalent-cation tolerance protein CutA [Desulfovibrio sp. OttesenSCG-928-G15]|nr:divalent-cation tolerance protein CutA [Desulfovibrio sp. OttesenSCG-928-G15]
MRAFFVYITTPDRATARSMAEVLVQERLCACANILDGMESVYWWQGKVHTGREAVLICKTTEAGYAAFEQRARALHPYDTPCITALPIAAGFAPFLQWIADETRS